tara:strand:+ start:479 stop:976 length:498 start_codon:yes stop_codon:yes gene_type:complete
MVLPTSGPISLNQIHIEVGGSSGTTCTINDSDIRDLINKASGATMSFNEWYGSGTEEQYSATSPETAYSVFDNYFQGTENYSIVWNGSIVVNTSNASYNFLNYQSYYNNATRISTNTPFPAHSGTIGGWRYFARRGQAAESVVEDDYGYGASWKVSRTTRSVYPY